MNIKVRVKRAILQELNKYIERGIDGYVKDVSNADKIKCLLESADFVNNYLGEARCYDNWEALMDAGINLAMQYDDGREALFLEFGVYKGQTINYIAKRIKGNKIIGFDTFEGLPEDWRSGYKKGTFKLDKLPKVESNVRLVKGLFSDSLKKFQVENKRLAFIHIDCDLYRSTKDIFESLGGAYMKNTVIIFNEFYNYVGWKNGEYLALKEFEETNDIVFKYFGYVGKSEQVGIIVR